MADHDREQLLGYVLNALEAEERRAVERRLCREPRLRRDLAHVREELQPLAATRARHAPPRGLAARTCELVGLFAGPAPAPRVAIRRRRPSTAPSTTDVPTAASWKWTDLAVALSVFAAVCLTLVPGLLNARVDSRRTACQDNLRQFGVAYTAHRQAYPGQLPNARPSESRWNYPGSAASIENISMGRNILWNDGHVAAVVPVNDARFLPQAVDPADPLALPIQ